MAGLTEMPKVGEKVRYIGEDFSFMTIGKEYEVIGVTSNGFQYLDDDGSDSFDLIAEFDEWEAVIEAAKQPDAVNSPTHYTQGDIEVIDYIDQVAESYVGRDAAYAANVIKYVSRAPHKNGVEDIKKAVWYAERLAESMAKRAQS